MRVQLAAILMLVVACGGTETPPTATVPLMPPPDAAIDAAPVAALTPTKQFEWVLAAMQAGSATDAEITARFHPSFLARLPASQLLQVFGQMKAQLGEVTVVSVTEPDVNHVLAILDTSAGKIRASLSVDRSTGQIDSLLFKPDAGEKPATFEAAVTLAASVAPKASLLVARLDRGTCKPVHASSSSEELAIGSTFKLYVLLGLADQIAAKKLTWDGELAVRDDWKSLPSGVTQNDAAGTKLSIKALAERMIMISDNTATDHVLLTVGRDKVEAALKTAKHAKPALNIPFLTTRELFVLKLGLTEEERGQYLKANTKGRRGQLAAFAKRELPPITAAEGWETGRHVEDLEWFASGDDLCRVMGTLWSRAQKPVNAPLLEVLSKNPGIPLDPAKWPFIGFKGGSEPGVMNLTWLLRRADDQWFVVSVGLNAPAGAIDESKALGLATGLIDLASAAAAP